MKITHQMTSIAICKILGDRIKQYRIDKDMTQNDLSVKTGISIRNIVRIEKGEDTQLRNFIKILLALELADNLDLFIPDYEMRPKFQARKNKFRTRVTKSTKKIKSSGNVIWGDGR